MDVRRFGVIVGAAVLAAPLTGWTSMPAAASGPRSSAVPASACFASQDNGDPELKTFDVSPHSVDARTAAQVVRFSATAEDTGGPGAASGVVGGTVYVSFDDSGNFSLSAPLEPDGKGSLVGTLTILPAYATATRYLSVGVTDAAGNGTTYSTEDLETMGMPTTFTTTTTPDAAPPAVRTVRFSSTIVDTRRHARVLTVRIRATDDSGVAAMRIWLWGSSVRHSGGRMALTSGTPKDGVWVARLRIPRWQGNSVAKLAVEMSDLDNRWRNYGPKRLAAIGQRGTVRILSRTDPAPPTVRLRSVRPGTVDVRTGKQTATVLVRVRDRGSGVRSVQMTVSGPNDSTFDGGLRLTRVAGTRYDGVWRGTIEFAPCRPAGSWDVTVFAWDQHDGSYLALPQLTVVNGDVVRPTAELTGDSSQVRRSGPLTVQFSEDVVGVDGDNTWVQVGYDQRGRGGSDPTPVPGTWTCKDAAAAVVDCLAGPVRTAAFTPAAPMAAGTNHTLVLNPEHHLGLTDLAGNPYAPGGLSFQTR
jgi:hypothetical protein